MAYTYGIASSQTYLNDWFWVPLMLFGWLPILYFTRLVSIPEYFEKRFGRRERRIATWLLLVYLIGYVGINLFTMGQALNILLGWPVLACAAGVAAISAVYVTSGGQTSVIMTDLFQGMMLLATGAILLWLGIDYMGDFETFWSHLPTRTPNGVHQLQHGPELPQRRPVLAGRHGQHRHVPVPKPRHGDATALRTLGQGLPTRRHRDVHRADAHRGHGRRQRRLGGQGPCSRRRAPTGHPGQGGLLHRGRLLVSPGVFGLIMAALTAALMSTVDTLITAVAAIYVNDIYKPKNPNANETQLLRAARISSVSVTAFGVALVPVFMGFDSIYSAHGAFTAAVTPPLVVTLLLGVFWHRFSAKAAFLTMIGGSAVILASVVWPELITPFAHGVPMKEVEDGFLSGKNQYKFMRAFFGLAVCSVIGIVAGLSTKGRPLSRDPRLGLGNSERRHQELLRWSTRCR